MRLVVQKEDCGRTGIAVLKEKMFFSRALLRRIKRQGKAWINGKEAFLTSRVKEGDVLEVDTEIGRQSDIIPQDIPLDILYEDDAILAVNKPAGMLVHPVGKEIYGTLANAVMGHWRKAQKSNCIFRPVFRIDRDTSGLVLISGHHTAHLGLLRQMAVKNLKRQYIAVAGGRIEEKEGIIDQPIARKAGSIIEREISPSGSRAVTNFTVLGYLPNINATVLEVSLETGRTHQIRVHLSGIGHPLLGDSLYGGCLSLIKRQALHSHQITFDHPEKGVRLDLVSPLPADIINITGDMVFHRFSLSER